MDNAYINEFLNENEKPLARRLEIDTEWIQNLQDYFSEMTNLFLFLVDEDGKMLTKMSGDSREVSRISSVVTDKQLGNIFERVMYSKTEDQVIENTKDACVKLGVSAIRIGTRCELMYVTIGVIAEEITENGDYDKLLRRTSFKRFLDGKQMFLLDDDDTAEINKKTMLRFLGGLHSFFV